MLKTMARHRRTALDVEQRRVPGVTDLAGEVTYAVSFRASREQWIDDADARVAEIGPVALSFQAKHPLTGLPTVAELSADDASGPFAATVNEDCASHPNEIPTITALAPMQGFPGANQEQITTFKAYVERKLKQTVISWKSFCVQRIFKKLSAFKSNTFSLN
jgi:hypothetical protein